jgi:PST family polysaccharide transporter
MALGLDTNELAGPATKNLGRRAARGGIVVFTSTALQKVVALGVMAVLARLLTPEDYGLIGMVFALTAFIHVFAEMGLVMATVQKRELTRPQLSTVFWLNLAFSVLLAGIAAAAAPGIAWFYGEPRLVWLALLASAGFVFAGLGMQHVALMMRRMQFGRLAACDFAALLAGGATGIAMALHGWRAGALVGQTLVQTLTRSLVAWILAGWIPGFPVRGSGVRGMLRFGGYLTGFNILNYFSRNMDKVLLGRFWGTAEVGLYGRAYALMVTPILLIVGPLSRVMMPAFSLLQLDIDRFGKRYTTAVALIALVSFPMAAGMFAFAGPIVVTVFGSRWAGAIPVFRVLCVAAAWQGMYCAIAWVYVPLGKTRSFFLWGLLSAPVFCVAFGIGIRWGSLGVAAAYVVAVSILAYPGAALAYRHMHVSPLTALWALRSPFLGTCMFVVVMLAIPFVSKGAILTPSPISLLGATAAYAVTAWLVDPSLVRNGVHLVRSAFRSQAPGSASDGDGGHG